MTGERKNIVPRSPLVSGVEVMTHIPMSVAPLPEAGVDQTQAESAQGRLTWPPRSKRQTSM